MKKRLIAGLLSLVLLCLCGCGKQGEAEGLLIYYLRPDATGTGALLWSPSRMPVAGQTETELCTAVLEALMTPPYGSQSPIPEGVGLNSLRVVGAIAYVDFTKPYQTSSLWEKSLTAAGVTLSLSQLPGVTYVLISCMGAPQAPMYEQYCTASSFMIDDSVLY